MEGPLAGLCRRIKNVARSLQLPVASIQETKLLARLFGTLFIVLVLLTTSEMHAVAEGYGQFETDIEIRVREAGEITVYRLPSSFYRAGNWIVSRTWFLWGGVSVLMLGVVLLEVRNLWPRLRPFLYLICTILVLAAFVEYLRETLLLCGNSLRKH